MVDVSFSITITNVYVRHLIKINFNRCLFVLKIYNKLLTYSVKYNFRKTIRDTFLNNNFLVSKNIIFCTNTTKYFSMLCLHL